MASYNKVILVGNLTRDPELRYTPQAVAVCEFGIAINEKYTSGNGQKVEKVHFFDIVAWKRTAELVSQYCKKGTPILVDGKLTQDRWQDQQSGQNRSKVKITAERIQFLGQRPNGQAAPAPAGAPAAQRQSQEQEPLVVTDPDLPF